MVVLTGGVALTSQIGVLVKLAYWRAHVSLRHHGETVSISASP